MWPTIARLAGGTQVLAEEAETVLAAGEAEKALHLIEIAVEAAPEDRVVRTTEARILVRLIDNTGGEGFDEIGWLESRLAEARRIAEREGNV